MLFTIGEKIKKIKDTLYMLYLDTLYLVGLCILQSTQCDHHTTFKYFLVFQLFGNCNVLLSV